MRSHLSATVAIALLFGGCLPDEMPDDDPIEQTDRDVTNETVDVTVPEPMAPDVSVPDAAPDVGGAPPIDFGTPDAMPDVAPGCPDIPPGSAAGRPARMRAVEVAAYPHDNGAFTQGLAWYAGRLYEGTGLNGGSSLREVDLASGEVLRRVDLARMYFGEGIVPIGDRIHQLTWRSQVGFVYDRATFQRLGEFRYEGEGWGLTSDGTSLIRSDGSDQLHWHQPDGFARIGSVSVFERDGDDDDDDDRRRIDNLNELEWIEGEVWANEWMSDDVVRIDPESGRITARIDAAHLGPRGAGRDDVLNGIAFDPETCRIWLTGKRWPVLYEVEIVVVKGDDDDD